MTKKYLTGFLGVAVLCLTFSTLTTSVLASGESNCVSMYGTIAYGAQCQTGQLSIKKKIQNPKTGEFLDNLSANDATFNPSGEINFRIEVKNNGSVALNNIQIQDKFPDNVSFVSGPGTFDGNQTLTWTIAQLNPGESSFFQIKVQVKSLANLPKSTISCVTNLAQAQLSGTANNQLTQSTASFCVQAQLLQGVGPVQELPRTGPLPIIWLLLGLIPLGVVIKTLTVSKKDNKESALYLWQKRNFFQE